MYRNLTRCALSFPFCTDPKPNYYTLLNIPENANFQTIRDKYRQLSKQYHPDSPTGSQHKFIQLQQAFQCLSDPAKRRLHDQHFGLDEHLWQSSQQYALKNSQFRNEYYADILSSNAKVRVEQSLEQSLVQRFKSQLQEKLTVSDYSKGLSPVFIGFVLFYGLWEVEGRWKPRKTRKYGAQISTKGKNLSMYVAELR